MLLSDAARHRQSQAGASAFRLGREERIEDAWLQVSPHSGSVVGHPQVDLLVVVPAVDADPARAGGGDVVHGQGLLCVDQQVEHDLADPVGVRINQRQCRVQSPATSMPPERSE